VEEWDLQEEQEVGRSGVEGGGEDDVRGWKRWIEEGDWRGKQGVGMSGGEGIDGRDAKEKAVRK
jgi:hypothetical protein